jgi:hypothetical protein
VPFLCRGTSRQTQNFTRHYDTTVLRYHTFEGIMEYDYMGSPRTRKIPCIIPFAAWIMKSRAQCLLYRQVDKQATLPGDNAVIHMLFIPPAKQLGSSLNFVPTSDNVPINLWPHT